MATCQNRGIISNILSQMGKGNDERAWEIELTIQYFTKAIQAACTEYPVVLQRL